MSYPKVTFGPMIERPSPSQHYLDVFFQTNGDWRGTDEGCMELQVVLAMLLEQNELFPKETEFEMLNANTIIMRLPCAKSTVFQWKEDLKKQLPQITGAVYAKNAVARLEL